MNLNCPKRWSVFLSKNRDVQFYATIYVSRIENFQYPMLYAFIVQIRKNFSTLTVCLRLKSETFEYTQPEKLCQAQLHFEIKTLFRDRKTELREREEYG